MAAVCSTPRSRSELAESLGHKSITGALRLALADLMEAGLIEYSIPDKPNSRLQKYRITSSIDRRV
jgi:ATP-dependent DNA helicase RecG